MIALQGPPARAPARRGSLEPLVDRRRVAEVEWDGVPRAWCRAPATRARTASRSRCRPTAARGVLGRGAGRGVRAGRAGRAGHAAARGRPAAARPRARARASRRCRPGWAGSIGWKKGAFRGREALEAERERGVAPAPARAAGRRPPAAPRRQPGAGRRRAGRRGHQRQLLADARARASPSPSSRRTSRKAPRSRSTSAAPTSPPKSSPPPSCNPPPKPFLRRKWLLQQPIPTQDQAARCAETVLGSADARHGGTGVTPQLVVPHGLDGEAGLLRAASKRRASASWSTSAAW